MGDYPTSKRSRDNEASPRKKGRTLAPYSKDGFKVEVDVEDLSRGLLRSVGESLLGISDVEGIFHSSVRVNSKEYWFHLDGLHVKEIEQESPPGDGKGTAEPDAGKPEDTSREVETIRVSPFCDRHDYGTTFRTEEDICDWVEGVAREKYTSEKYCLFDYNCNNFTTEFLDFLGTKPLPRSVVIVPSQVLATPVGAMLRPAIDGAINAVRQNRVNLREKYSNSKEGPHSPTSSVIDDVLGQLSAQPGGFFIAPVIAALASLETNQFGALGEKQRGAGKGS